MAVATIQKRIRQTRRVIYRTTGSKRERYERKLAYLKDLNPNARFYAGSRLPLTTRTTGAMRRGDKQRQTETPNREGHRKENKMVRVVMCISEARSRDRKRKRLLLIVGQKQYHISRLEAKGLARDIISRLK